MHYIYVFNPLKIGSSVERNVASWSHATMEGSNLLYEQCQ